jgi:hypothetical protein
MKTKIKMNNSYDNYNYIFIKKRFLSEAAKLMKHKGFYNLNLISNHNFYNNFYFFLKNLEKNLIFFLFFKNNLIKTNIVPNFLFSKQIFFDFKNFLKFSNKHNVKYLFIKNSELKNFGYLNNDLYGNNFLLFSNKFLNNKNLADYKNEYNLDIFLKNNYNFSESNLIDLSTISYFLNFNLFISNMVDIYKILILLNLNNLYKNN